MYSYNSMPRYSKNMYYRPSSSVYSNQSNDRLIGAGFVGPLLLGGLAGYAIGRPNYYPYPAPYPVYYNNYYYPYQYY